MNENEVWKPYPEFSWIEGSSLGRVRTRDRMVSNGKGTRLEKGRILKQRLDKNGYLRVEFNVNGKLINRKAHRIIASCFIPNPDNLPQVNHKDCDRTNNCVSNLEWCDASYNCRYREKYGKAFGRPVYAVNLKTLEVSCFQSRIEASRVLGVSQGSIGRVVRGKLKQAGGYWFTEDDGKDIEIDKDKLREIKAGMEYRGDVFAVNLSTLEVLQFSTQSEAGRSLGVYVGNINKVIAGKQKTAKGYWFMEVNENAVEITRNKFGDVVADQVEKLMNKKEMQLA